MRIRLAVPRQQASRESRTDAWLYLSSQLYCPDGPPAVEYVLLLR